MDETPVSLLIVSGTEACSINLDERGWSETYSDWMRRPGIWYLVDLATQTVRLVMAVFEGEQPYYTKRVVGQINTVTGAGRQTAAYGIGKKRLDGHVDRLWLMPGGAVCGGDDVERLVLDIVSAMEWQPGEPI